MHLPISGERVRNLRLASEISQAELAAALGLNGNSVISKIENGRVTVDEALLHQLAERLDCSPQYLQQASPDVLFTRPWLRAYADASAKVIEAVTADNVVHHEFVQQMKLRRVPHRIPVFDGDVNDVDAIEAFAQEVRAAAEIQEGDVVRNAMRAAERLGCVILPLANELGRHLGMSQFVDEVPYIRVSRPVTNSGKGSIPGDRQRFTVIHEVGHLALHAGVAPPESADAARRIEQQAHRFAGAFLAPAVPLVEDLDGLGGRVTLNVLSELKGHWGVAIKMLVKRLQDIGVVAPEQATSLYKQISKRGWNTGEPVPVTNEEPIWFERALGRRATADESARIAVAQDLGSSHLSRWLDWRSGPAGDATVVSLATRRAARA